MCWLTSCRAWRRLAFLVEHVQLDAQALGQIPCRHAGRVEVLQQVQHGNDLVVFREQRVIRAQVQRLHGGTDVIEAVGQVAALVEGVDDGFGNGVVGIAQVGQVELPEQVLLERFRCGAAGLPAVAFLIGTAAGTGAGAAAGVDVVPVGIHPQVIIKMVGGVEVELFVVLVGTGRQVGLGLTAEAVALVLQFQ